MGISSRQNFRQTQFNCTDFHRRSFDLVQMLIIENDELVGVERVAEIAHHQTWIEPCRTDDASTFACSWVEYVDISRWIDVAVNFVADTLFSWKFLFGTVYFIRCRSKVTFQENSQQLTQFRLDNVHPIRLTLGLNFIAIIFQQFFLFVFCSFSRSLPFPLYWKFIEFIRNN